MSRSAWSAQRASWSPRSISSRSSSPGGSAVSTIVSQAAAASRHAVPLRAARGARAGRRPRRGSRRRARAGARRRRAGVDRRAQAGDPAPVGEHARPALVVARVGDHPRPLAPGGQRERGGFRAQVLDLEPEPLRDGRVQPVAVEVDKLGVDRDQAVLEGDDARAGRRQALARHRLAHRASGRRSRRCRRSARRRSAAPRRDRRATPARRAVRAGRCRSRRSPAGRGRAGRRAPPRAPRRRPSRAARRAARAARRSRTPSAPGTATAGGSRA